MEKNNNTENMPERSENTDKTSTDNPERVRRGIKTHTKVKAGVIVTFPGGGIFRDHEEVE